MRFLLDANIALSVKQKLRIAGFEAFHVADVKLGTASDGEILAFAKRHRYIVITHDIPLTYKIADKIAMLHEGRIVEQGDVDYMKSSPNPILRQFLEGRSEGPIKVL